MNLRRKNQLLTKFSTKEVWSEETIKFLYDYFKTYFGPWITNLERKLEYSSISKVGSSLDIRFFTI